MTFDNGPVNLLDPDTNLRLPMAERDMFQTTDLVPRLAEYGYTCRGSRCSGWSRSPPQRLSMDTLAVLCAILDCSPADLITVKEVRRQIAKPTASGESATSTGAVPPVRRVRVRRPDDL
ncbi:helix-turn-helix transcriptional regulator [Kitasatospora sp. NPDC085879]|uniref:helix-turn-helix domain-containing protein n=1 Tax=Kitasatospora sp. NPDC085879 TaxID=3154769 RepID=UPI0034309853